MSLRAFHLLFISLSIVLAIVFGLWSTDVYLRGEPAGYLVSGILSFIGAAALGVYETRFIRKLRRLA